MANQLDEMNNKPLAEGRDIQVIPKQLEVEKEASETAYVVFIFILGVALAISGLVLTIQRKQPRFLLMLGAGIITVFALFIKIQKSKQYFDQLEQRIQTAASTVDNYQDQRVNILQNVAALLQKSIDLDRTVFTDIAKARSGNYSNADVRRNEVGRNLDYAGRRVAVVLENYPELRAHQDIQSALQQNSYLAMEITAAREAYNDVVGLWNREIMVWPIKKYVAGKRGLTTRIPYIASQEVKERSESVFF